MLPPKILKSNKFVHCKEVILPDPFSYKRIGEVSKGNQLG